MSASGRRRKRTRIVAGAGLGVGAALGASATAQAADFTVTNLNDAGPGSLRQAILDANAAPSADRVLFQSSLSGTITLTTGELAISDSVQILGPGPGNLTISGNGASRILYSYPLSPKAVTVSGLALINGAGTTGGAIRFHKVDLTLSNSVVTGNNASGGNGAAGVYSSHGSLTIQSSTISGNVASDGRGGGIRTYRSPTIIQSSTISGNSATEASTEGGGVYTYRDSLTIQDSTISGNTATGTGGGINTFRTAIVIQRSTISGNSVSDPTSSGGGIYAYAGSMTLESDTVSGNSAKTRGGGASVFNVTPASLANTIVAGNTAATGPELIANAGHAFDATFSLVQNTAGAVINGSSNLFAQDPKLAPLANNGGPTQTEALLDGSPALDSGIGTGVDQRGAPRPFDLKGIAHPAGGNSADIGAYERNLCGGRVVVNRIGTEGKDLLVGTSGPDGILGLGGKDTLKGLGGNDALCAGPGKDKLKGGAGKDKLLGQAGNDVLIGGKGHDILKGGKGKDKQTQ